MTGSAEFLSHTKTRTTSAPAASSTHVTFTSAENGTPGRSAGARTCDFSRLYIAPAVNMMGTSYMGLVPVFLTATVILKRGPRPCTCASSLAETPPLPRPLLDRPRVP